MWNSLTSVGKAPACPGECVHAITSIFCDNVLEEVTCGANFLRCCVPHEFSYGTPVETSAPINDHNNNPEDQTKISSTTPHIAITTSTTTTTTTTTTPTPRPTEAQAITSHPLMVRPHNPKPYNPSVVFGSLNVNKLIPVPTSSPSPPPLSSTERTTTQRQTLSSETSLESSESQVSQSSISISSMAEPCPGVCIKLRYVRYCSNILSNGKCPNDGDQCCLQSEVDFDNTSNIVTVVHQSDSLNVSKEEPKNQTSEETKVEEIAQSGDQTKESGPTTPLPLCEGTCVAPLFSLLCDETDYNLYCPNGGSCCVNREPITEAPQLKPCPGSCIPTILSGMCNRPSELILKTLDCTSGSICCHNPHETASESHKDVITEETHPSKDDRPLQPPIIPQNYNTNLFGSETNPIPVPLFVSGPAIHRPPPNPMPVPMMPSIGPLHDQMPPPMRPLSIPIPKQEPTRPVLPPLRPDSEIDSIEAIESSSDNQSNGSLTGGPPFCPGPCIAPMFR